MKAF
jgi:hypothetical protein